jgi:low temperature requirement protein LtrA
MMRSERDLLRHRNGHGHARVTFVELFFDLVFVFAVTQLSHSLIEHFTLVGAAQTLLLMLAVWWVWIYTAWVTNWLDPEQRPVRLLLLALMLVGLILSSSIPKAFESRGLAFAGAYVGMQVGRTLFFLWAVKGQPGMVRTFQRILAWLVLAGVFWIAGSLVEATARLGLWVLALGLEYVSPSLGFRVPGLGRSTTADWNVEGGHMSERCGLFIIIALGESILVTGATFSGLAWTPATVAAFMVSFAGSLAMWWLYFDTTAEVGSETISASGDPGQLARLAYTYVHLFLVAGIIVAAVADELVLAHPLGHSEPKITVAVLGGAALYLVGNALFKWAIAGRLPVSPIVGVLLQGLLIPASVAMSPLALMTIATLVLVAVAAWEARTRRYCPPPRLEAKAEGDSPARRPRTAF